MGILKAMPRIAGVILSLLMASMLVAATPTEYQVKAVFLFNFSQFVEWPGQAFSDATAPIVIGVLGEDPFGAALDETIAGETVNGRRLAVRRYRSVEEVDTCHILFINEASTTKLEAALEALRARHVLTVGDAVNFARAGGVIQFVNVGNRIRLQINVDAAKQANLALSSKLLRPAEIVKTAQG